MNSVRVGDCEVIRTLKAPEIGDIILCTDTDTEEEKVFLVCFMYLHGNKYYSFDLQNSRIVSVAFDSLEELYMVTQMYYNNVRIIKSHNREIIIKSTRNS